MHRFIGISKHLFENQVNNAKFRDKHSNCYSKEVKVCSDPALLFWKAYDLMLQGPFFATSNRYQNLGNISWWWSWLFLWCDQVHLRYGSIQVIYVRYCIDNWCDGHSQNNMVGYKRKCHVRRIDYSIGLHKVEGGLETEALMFIVCGILGHWKQAIV